MTFAQATIGGKLTDVAELGEKSIIVLISNKDLEIPLLTYVYGEMATRILAASKEEGKELFAIIVGELESEDGSIVLKSRSVSPCHNPISFSNVSVVGNLGQDVEAKTGKSKAFLKNSLAVNKKVKGEKKTSWFRFVAFSKTAETIEKYCDKGNQIAVHGSLATSEYTDKKGELKTSTEIKAYSFNFITGTRSKGNSQESNQGWKSETSTTPENLSSIPF